MEWIGKPYKTIYAKALDNWSDIKPERILCIGDSPAHYVAGGKVLGFKVALVQTGIHQHLSGDDLLALCSAEVTEPDFIRPAFSL